MDLSPIFDPRTYEKEVPYDLLAEARAATPVVRIPEAPMMGWPEGPGYWAVFRHRSVRKVLRDTERFSSAMGGTQIRDPDTPDDLAYVQRMMLNMDPPEHTRIRRLLTRSFTPSAVKSLENGIIDRVTALVDGVMGRSEFDFVMDLAADLPVATLAQVMGVPEEDRYLLYDWSNRVIGYLDDEYAASDHFTPGAGASDMARHAFALRPVPDAEGQLPNPRSRDGMPDLYGYANSLAEYKRDNPGNDVMSILLRAQDEDGAITNEEFENLFWLFAVAGNETLRNGIPGGMMCLLQNPDAYRALRNDPSVMDQAVEEMLRYWPPVIHFRRTATTDTEIDGVDIARGDKVVVYHAAANRDPEAFDHPDVFDITRSPNDHVSFGFGAHFCLGAYLARTQMQTIFTQLMTRLPQLELAGTAERLTSNFQNGVKHLPVRVT
ncbi:MAG: cytochrome P450 [Acidimicrobiia bacterium]|nr:cytochrome P450 [Acidimicrobiia bacterium]